ncbi:MAG: aspartate/glutamate racemase family protein [Ilumatobacteraceae bacterium]
MAELPVPVLSVIEPGASSLVQATRSGNIGVIATVATVRSGAYQHEVEATAEAQGRSVQLTCAACPGLVEFVEKGAGTTGDQVTVLTERLLAPVRDAGVDTLLLGCTHYPFLARVIGDVMGPEVVLVSSADETAFAVAAELERLGILRPSGSGRPGEHRFLSSGDVSTFVELGSRLLGPELAAAHSWAPDTVDLPARP